MYALSQVDHEGKGGVLRAGSMGQERGGKVQGEASIATRLYLFGLNLIGLLPLGSCLV